MNTRPHATRTFTTGPTVDAAGLTPRAVRAARILDEARETEDPVHLVRVFGIPITTAMKYIHTAHPHRGGPLPP